MNHNIQETQKDDQDFWNIVYSVFFVIFCIILVKILIVVRGDLPTSIPLFDLILIILATFRLVRLFVYDKITRFLRSFFFEANEVYTEEGVTYFSKKERMHGPMRTAYELLTCPWCFSVWAAIVLVFFYFVTSYAWLVILVLAISGVASIIQLLANAIGWSAENGKIQATKAKE